MSTTVSHLALVLVVGVALLVWCVARRPNSPKGA
jgi:hypothetical protein